MWSQCLKTHALATSLLVAHLALEACFQDEGIICSAPTNLQHRGFTCRIEITLTRHRDYRMQKEEHYILSPCLVQGCVVSVLLSTKRSFTLFTSDTSELLHKHASSMDNWSLLGSLFSDFASLLDLLFSYKALAFLQSRFHWD